MTPLEKLNTLRIAIGMKPLKAWKESKAKLEAAIAKLEETAPAAGPAPHEANAIEDTAPVTDTTPTDDQPQEDTMAKKTKTVEVKKIPTGMTAKKIAAQKAKDAKAAAKAPKTAKPKSTAAKKTPSDGVKVSTIAEELGIDPKVARAKLRRHFGDTPKAGGGQWVFTKDKVAEIKSILKGDQRKKS